jgi:hypothetical protein
MSKPIFACIVAAIATVSSVSTQNLATGTLVGTGEVQDLGAAGREQFADDPLARKPEHNGEYHKPANLRQIRSSDRHVLQRLVHAEPALHRDTQAGVLAARGYAEFGSNY